MESKAKGGVYTRLLNEALEKTGLVTESLAKELKVPYGTVYSIASGKVKNPKKETQISILAGLANVANKYNIKEFKELQNINLETLNDVAEKIESVFGNIFVANNGQVEYQNRDTDAGINLIDVEVEKGEEKVPEIKWSPVNIKRINNDVEILNKIFKFLLIGALTVIALGLLAWGVKVWL